MGKETISVLEPDYVVDLRVQLGKVINLNEELTAENARLLTELEEIKSKWWYKLMTWGW